MMSQHWLLMNSQSSCPQRISLHPIFHRHLMLATATTGYPWADEYSLADELDLLHPPPGWLPDDHDERIYEGLVRKDDDQFWSIVSKGGFVVRSTTNKKSKKLDTMNKLLDSDDLMKSRTLQGKTKPKVAHRPPVGKVWIKQSPLDSSSSPWDATSPSALTRVHKDMAAKDPYLTAITHPCGP